MSSFHRSDWLAIVSPIVTLIGLAGIYYVAYWQERGKSRASAESIDSVTRPVEQIKSEHAVSLESVRSHNQMRLAAVDKRLQAHQEAFKLWRKLFKHAHSDKVHEVVEECQTWWEDNCLYLDRTARDAFADAYWAAAHHRMYLDVIVRDADSIARVQENWAKIEKAGDLIIKAADLPGLTSVERKELREAEQEQLRNISDDR